MIPMYDGSLSETEAQADFVVVQHGFTDTEEGNVYVTPFWIEHCMEVMKYVPPNKLAVDTTYLLGAFMPREHFAAIPGMSAVHACVTTGTGGTQTVEEAAERGAIIRLVELVGGICEERMSKKATTHLICSSIPQRVHRDGSKYQSAVKWKKTIIVTPRWLEACLTAGRMVDPDEFHPDCSTTAFIKYEHQKEDEDDIEPSWKSAKQSPRLVTTKSQPEDHFSQLSQGSQLCTQDTRDFAQNLGKANSRVRRQHATLTVTNAPNGSRSQSGDSSWNDDGTSPKASLNLSGSKRNPPVAKRLKASSVGSRAGSANVKHSSQIGKKSASSQGRGVMSPPPALNSVPDELEMALDDVLGGDDDGLGDVLGDALEEDVALDMRNEEVQYSHPVVASEESSMQQRISRAALAKEFSLRGGEEEEDEEEDGGHEIVYERENEAKAVLMRGKDDSSGGDVYSHSLSGNAASKGQPVAPKTLVNDSRSTPMRGGSRRGQSEDKQAATPIASAAPGGTDRSAAHSEVGATQPMPMTSPLKVFMFSGLKQEVNLMYTHVLQRLGATITTKGTEFDTDCTHMIVGSMRVSEKVLGACARGVCFLKQTYVNESDCSSAFADESKHMWTMEGNADTDDVRAVEASMMWRDKLPPGCGCFHQMKAFTIFGAATVNKQHERLLRYGGAENVTKKLDGSSLPKGITHVFIDAKMDKDPLVIEAHKQLTAKRVPCLRPDFLRDFILFGPSKVHSLDAKYQVKLTEKNPSGPLKRSRSSTRR